MEDCLEMKYRGNQFYWQQEGGGELILPFFCDEISLEEFLSPVLLQAVDKFPAETTVDAVMERVAEVYPDGERCGWKDLDQVLPVLTEGTIYGEFFYSTKRYEDAFLLSLYLLEKICLLEDYMFKRYGLLVNGDRVCSVLIYSLLAAEDQWEFFLESLCKSVRENKLVYYNFTIVQIIHSRFGDRLGLEDYWKGNQGVPYLKANLEVVEGEERYTKEYSGILQEYSDNYADLDDLTEIVAYLVKYLHYTEILELLLEVLVSRQKNVQAQGIVLDLFKDYHYQRSRTYLFKQLYSIKSRIAYHQYWVMLPDMVGVSGFPINFHGFAHFLQDQKRWAVDGEFHLKKFLLAEESTVIQEFFLEVEDFVRLFDMVKESEELYKYSKVLVSYFPEQVYQRYAILLEKAAKQARVPYDYEMVCRRIANLVDIKGTKVAKHLVHLFRINYRENRDFLECLKRMEEKSF